MNSVTNFIEKMTSVFETTKEEECSQEEIIDDLVDAIKKKLPYVEGFSSSPSIEKKRQKTPNFAGFNVREKMASSPYYKGNLHKVIPEKTSLIDRIGDILKRKTGRTVEKDERVQIRAYFRQRYVDGKIYKCNNN